MFVLCFLCVWDKKLNELRPDSCSDLAPRPRGQKQLLLKWQPSFGWRSIGLSTQRRHRVRGRNTQGSCSKPATFLQWWCTSICRKPTCQHHSCTSIPVERTLHHPHSPHKICVEHVEKINSQVKGTPPKFNSSPLKNLEKWWGHDYFSFWESLWKKGLC